MQWREILNDYFSFTRKERVGVMMILLIITLAIFLPLFFSQRDLRTVQHPDSTWINAVSKLEQKNTKSDVHDKRNQDVNIGVYQYDQRRSNYYKPEKPSQTFYFDPNTLSTDGWEKLGLAGKTIHTIQNYLAKGGRFKKPGDLERMYGLRKEDYERLAPYIRIASPVDEIKTEIIAEKKTPGNNHFKSSKFSYQPVDINTADTTALILLPGIGSKLALRIISFRNKLGGFYTIDQVSETFGLPDSTFQKLRQYLKLDHTLLKKININTASIEELKNHPYIRYAIANAIVTFRKEHGHFLTIDEIKKVMLITDEVYRKILPYLTITN